MANLLERISHFVAGKRTKWITLVVWIILAGILSAVLPGVNQKEDNNAANLDSQQPSVQATLLAEQEFPSEAGLPALLVWKREGGLLDEDYENLQKLTAYFTQNPLEGQKLVVPFDRIPLPALKQQASEDGTAIVLPFFFDKSTDSDQIKAGVAKIQEQAKANFGSDPFVVRLSEQGQLSARVTGPAGVSLDAVGLFSNADVTLLMATVILVLVLLLLIYRSPILAIIPLIAVGFAYGVTGPILGKLADLGWITVDSQGISIMTVLLFGAGTDYCLFLISRYRQLLKEEEDKTKALVRAFKDSSGAIAMSGFTVVMALLVLLFAKYGAVHRFAIPFSLSILIMGIASLTLVPALLAIFGRTSFFPQIPRTPQMEADRAQKKGKTKVIQSNHKVGGWIGKLVTNRPWLVLAATLVLLGAFAMNTFRIEYTVDIMSSFPEDSPSREGFAVIADKFTPGELAPVKLMVDTQGIDVPLKEVFSDLPYISKVSDITQGKNNSNIHAVDLEFNMNPYSNEAMKHIPDIRRVAVQVLEDAGITAPEDKVWAQGLTSTQYDTEETNARDQQVIIPIVIGLIAILLLVYLRSIIAMIYLILTVVLSYFSALGLGWFVLHDVMGASAIQGLIPLYAFVFLVALGEDYNIFLISSIWKKRRSILLKDAIREGVSETGGVITSAGLILAGTFAVLATLPIQVLVHFGTICAIGVLLDTFIVRPLLVPAITMLLGKWAFWPGKADGEASKVVEQSQAN